MKTGFTAFVAAAIVTMTVPAIVQAQQEVPNRDSCVLQVTKNTTTADRAQFVLACGSETLAAHDIRPFSDMTVEEALETKAIFRQVVKNLVGENSNCHEWDSELYFIAICTK